jgi:hypothetical protein
MGPTTVKTRAGLATAVSYQYAEREQSLRTDYWNILFSLWLSTQAIRRAQVRKSRGKSGKSALKPLVHLFRTQPKETARYFSPTCHWASSIIVNIIASAFEKSIRQAHPPPSFRGGSDKRHIAEQQTNMASTTSSPAPA